MRVAEIFTPVSQAPVSQDRDDWRHGRHHRHERWERHDDRYYRRGHRW